MASLWYNFDLDLKTFLYDASATRITFRESLNAGDNGKAIVLLGVYDVTLDGDTMVLSQPEAAVGVLGFGASEKATYYLHRAPKSEKPRETTDD